MHFRTEIVTTFERFITLEHQWNSLLKTSNRNSVFYTHQWFRAWWEAYASNHQLFIVCVFCEDTLVGVAPLYFSKSKFRMLPAKKLMFLANSNTDECGLIIAKQSPEVLGHILDCLAEEKKSWDLLDLNNIRIDENSPSDFETALNTKKLKWFTRESKRVPYISIDKDWENFWSQCSRRFKKAYNGRNNIILKKFSNVHVNNFTTPEELKSCMADILKISASSWKAKAGRALTDNPNSQTFFKALTKHLGKDHMAQVWMLYFNDEPVAFEYHITFGGITNPIRADFTEKYHAYSPGAYLESVIIKTLFNDPTKSIVEYNTCGDNYDYLRRWTKLSRIQKRFWILSPSVYGRLLYPLALLRRPSLRKKVRKQSVAAIDSCRNS